jgi:alkanesulfonate monooxygenase SsuD/methylene tetrahydromethanopterin reductase-like flavin-dependent oxidoreductase (luciferase family)
LSPEQAIERVQETKRNAAALGRELQVLSTGFVVCRPTQKEAEDYYHYYAVEQADWDAVDRVLELVLGKEGPQGMEAEMAYSKNCRFFAQEVLPRLERMDLRQPFSEGSK